VVVVVVVDADDDAVCCPITAVIGKVNDNIANNRTKNWDKVIIIPGIEGDYKNKIRL